MPRQIVDATDVVPGKKGWTCIIQVVERHPVLYKALDHFPFQKRYRHYLLTDMKGTKVKAVMFDKDIDFFERSLQPFKRYKVSNANATVQDEKYQLHGYRFSWIIQAKTPVEPIIDKEPYALPCTFEVCKFTDLHKFAESDANIAVRGLIVHRFPVADISNTKCAKDYVLVNEEEIPIVLRLWKDLLADYDPNIDFNAEPVTVIASNLEVRTFHGLSLATRKNAYFIQNPPLPEQLSLTKWYAENKAKVIDWVKNKTYENNNRFFIPPKQEDILDLPAAMETFKTAKTCWVKGKIRLSVAHTPLYYVLCANCRMTVDAGVDWNIECSGCSVLSPMEVRLTIPVTLNDEHINFRSTLKSPDAEKLCPFTATEVKTLEEQGKSVMNDISIAMDNTEVFCFVKYYDKPMHGQILRRFVMLKTYTLDEMKTLTQNTTPEIAPTTSLSSPTDESVSDAVTVLSASSGKAHALETQFFTPSTKRVLEELAPECIPAQSSTSVAPAVKRAINFGTITYADLAAVASPLPDSDVNKVLESPKKKNKSQDKNV